MGGRAEPGHDTLDTYGGNAGRSSGRFGADALLNWGLLLGVALRGMLGPAVTAGPCAPEGGYREPHQDAERNDGERDLNPQAEVA